ncbi:SubName: Full=Related to YIP3 protein-proposed to be involved in ER to Golgi transport {ECO:0000313/EMBL:CCA66376.1} [Serendipita indica DSM 11827]|uniref:PRA1 family protein n=1 Tax=Serendipita indica (strain DSM 11827) TaxID=1109443 RepID=G4T4W3_SERID|nr:SubName: Full=Related to YIP3 protein-proposed to be involved in ER to Golgi transport {ECO:0000313/EMBL:CCA66376.1} [Serendipita indica DSM 11827]CCA66376.1 related to YIP3 protein-proposed to be involved in ER to Golgi transport [Serendipita indica DSM 11827]
MEVLFRAQDTLRNFRETKLSTLRPVGEFFDIHRISRPANTNEAFSRITYNTRHFSGNYLIIIGALAVYAVLANTTLLIALIFLIGGFSLINRFATEPIQIGENTITQKHLYTGLFVIGIPLLIFASPFGTIFWLVGASALVILTHACLNEPGVESEYATVQEAV